jgi:hypothetical protein
VLIYFPHYKTALERDDESQGGGVYHKLRKKCSGCFCTFTLFVYLRKQTAVICTPVYLQLIV